MALFARALHGRLHYGWIVTAAVFLVLLASAGIRAAPGVIIVPLETQFGWTRASISVAISINLVLYGLMGPFAGALMQRIGIRPVILAAMSGMAVSVGLSSAMTALWQWILIWGVVVGVCSGVTANVLGATIVNRWFSASRGVVLGVLTASMATGQLVFLPLLATVVERHGWQWVALIVAGVAAAMIPLLLFFVAERPQDLGLQPYGETGPAVAAQNLKGNPFTLAIETLGVGLKSRDFWLLAGSFFICGASTNGLIGTHLIAACLDHGIPEIRGASLLAAMGIFDLIGTTASGWLSDRYDNRVLLFWYYGLRGLSLLFLPYALDLSFLGLSLFAVFYGLDWIATVPPTVRLATDRFGRESAPIIFGWIAAAHQLGAGFAAFEAGFLRTELGSYFASFVFSGLLCLVSAVMVLRIGRRPRGPETAPVAA